jgi:hypothetical protein
VPASDMGFYEWPGSTIEYHRAQIREHLGFRELREYHREIPPRDNPPDPSSQRYVTATATTGTRPQRHGTHPQHTQKATLPPHNQGGRGLADVLPVSSGTSIGTLG